MRLVYIANVRLPTEKAYGIQIVKMCEAFASQTSLKLLYPYRINLIKEDVFSYYSVKSNFRVKQIPVVDFYFPGRLDKIAVAIKNFISARILVREALKEKADIYYTRDESVVYLLSKKGVRVVFECHKFSNRRKPFYSYLKKVDLKMVVISEGLKNDLTEFGLKEANILLARDGVDLEDFNLNIDRDEARRKIFPVRDRFKKIAVYIGHLYSWKGADILLKTASVLKEELSDSLIYIYGGTDRDIKRLRRGINDSVSGNLFIQGRIPHHQVPIILKAADCAILVGKESDDLSARYTSPLKMFEYMASGCPIAAQDLPSFREVLSEENSVLVRPEDPQDLAAKINWVFKNRETANKIAQQALRDVEGYSWSNRATNILNFL